MQGGIDRKDIKEENIEDSWRDSDSDDMPLSMLKLELKIEDTEINLKTESSDEYTNTKSKTRINKKKKTKQKLDKIKVKNKINPSRNRRYICIACNKTFRHHQRYWAHTKEHPNYTCYVCWKRFTSLESLDEHNKEHDVQLYICEEHECDQQFNNYRLFLKHRKNDHKIENYLPCIKCKNKLFNSHEQWDVSKG